MRVHVFQHVWFEDLGIIQNWAQENSFEVTRTAFYENEPVPSVDDIDWLVIMGGPMNVYEEEKYPWLKTEKFFIKEAIDAGKVVIGICLGAQLIADVLGAKVTKGKHKEIGWFPVRFKNNKETPALKSLPSDATVFHWHQDAFEIPEGAAHIAENDACVNQAFSFNGGKVLGFQFHMEMTSEGINRIIEQCGNDMVLGKYVQKEAKIMKGIDRVAMVNAIVRGLLDKLV